MALLPPLPDWDPDGTPDLSDDEARTAWRVEDDRGAEWVMRKLAHFKRRLADLSDQHADWTAQIEEWWRSVSTPLERDILWATGVLSDYALRVRAADPDRKTVLVPSGRVTTSSQPFRIVAVDPKQVAAVLDATAPDAWADVVETTVKVNYRELNRHASIVDEWVLDLACGCRASWLSTEPPDDMEVPWSIIEHRCDVTSEVVGLDVPVLRATTVRVGVAVVFDERGVAHRLLGAQVLGGDVTTTVTPQ